MVEYILSGGNENVIFCERGIRIFEIFIRFILDILVVLVVKEFLYLLIIVDFLYLVGRREFVIFLVKVVYVVGVDGIMVEVYFELDKVFLDFV